MIGLDALAYEEIFPQGSDILSKGNRRKILENCIADSVVVEIKLLGSFQLCAQIAVESVEFEDYVAFFQQVDVFLNRFAVGAYCLRQFDGKHNGRQIGFPTANIDCGPHPLLIPKDGVYAVRVSIGGKEYGGMLNIGAPSVRSDGKRTIEVNIFDFSADIYGATLTVEFIARVRDCRPMASLSDLQQQLTADKQTVTEILTQSLSYGNH